MQYIPSIAVTVLRGNLLHNVQMYQTQYPQLLLAPVLKSNAYGHGLVPVAEILNNTDVAFIVLDSLYEAQLVRVAGVQKKILVIGYTLPKNIVSCKFKNIAFTITSLNQLEELATIAHTPIHVHLKVDTGMHRQGVLLHEVETCLSHIQKNRHLILDGICSHFADADGDTDEFTRKQIISWERVVEQCRKSFPTIAYIHISASAGARLSGQITANVLRLGLGLYGIDPSPTGQKLPLKPALRMTSIISSVKHIDVGDSVGYNASYTAAEPKIIATVPVGYFEGVDRRLSNCGYMYVRGVACPIIGRVSMNITSIDVTGVLGVHEGDIVTVISDVTDEKNSIASAASIAGTIPWELLVHIPQHLQRVIGES